jgi:hypothetical protein
MRPGAHNTIILHGYGPTGGSADVLIWDGTGMVPPMLPTPGGGQGKRLAHLLERGMAGASQEVELVKWSGGVDRQDGELQ